MILVDNCTPCFAEGELRLELDVISEVQADHEAAASSSVFQGLISLDLNLCMLAYPPVPYLL
jgi:hypothetical protein